MRLKVKMSVKVRLVPRLLGQNIIAEGGLQDGKLQIPY
jgi:hypothetical protein